MSSARMKSSTNTLVTITIGGLSLSTFAADNTLRAPSADNAFLDDVPVALTASRLSQPITLAPVAMTVIDRQMIRDSGAWALSEVMRLVPGMSVAYRADSFYSADSVASHHGLLTQTISNRMQVLIDGRLVYSVLFGSVNWSELPITLQDIERIDVIRGPASATYGLNSFSGVINIITQHPSEAQGTVVSASYGHRRSEGQRSYGGKIGNFDYRLSASIRNDLGLEDGIQAPVTHSANDKQWGFNKYDNKKIQIIHWRGDYQINDNDSLEIQFGYKGRARQSSSYQQYATLSKSAENHSEHVHWRRALENNSELSVQAYHIQERVYARYSDSDGVSNGDPIMRRYDLKIQHTLSPFKDVRLVYGASTRYDKVYAPYYLGVLVQPLEGDYGFRLNRLFANVEWWTCPDLVVNLGGMSKNNSMASTQFTPRVVTNWQFARGSFLRNGYSKATRTTSLYDGVLNPPPPRPLQSEHVRAYKIGYMTKLGWPHIDVRLFDEKYSDLISFSKNLGTSFVPVHGYHTDSARVRSGETEVKWPITRWTQLTYGLMRSHTQSDNLNGVVSSDTMPATTQSLLISHQLSNQWSWSMGLAGYQSAKSFANGTKDDLAQGRFYFILGSRRRDGRIADNSSLIGARAEAALIPQNMTDTHYFEYRYDNERPGRLTRINLKLEL